MMAVVCLVMFCGTSARSGEKATILTGQSLELGDARHRLYGIDAPRPGDMCRLRGALRDCGRLARAALMDLTAGAVIVCSPSPTGTNGSRCLANGYDLSEGMVYTGWARARPDAPERLSRLTSEARRKRRGLWHTP